MLSWKWWPGITSWNAVTSEVCRNRSVTWWVLAKYVPGRDPSTDGCR